MLTAARHALTRLTVNGAWGAALFASAAGRERAR